MRVHVCVCECVCGCGYGCECVGAGAGVSGGGGTKGKGCLPCRAAQWSGVGRCGQTVVWQQLDGVTTSGGVPGSVMADANFEKTTGSVGTGMFCSVQ